MDISTIILIAIGLAMDAFAVSIANGMSTTHQKQKKAIITASFFGTFQMLMPVVGWLAGLGLKELIIGVDHWVAFGLLVFIGSRMIYESSRKENVEKESNLQIQALLAMAIATSIDALIIGLSFAFLETPLVAPIFVIGLVTFSLSFAGFLFGNVIGSIFGNRVKLMGGLTLIAIGAKILLEDLFL